MYRCKECGSEYETKPDYCDCGNDEFEIFVAPEKEEQSAIKAPQKEIRTPQPKFNPQPSVKKKSYSEFDRIKEIFDPVSTVIFLICVILSFVTLKYVANPATQDKKSEPQKQEVVNIPSIDSYWDNTLPKTEQTVKIEPEKTVKAEPEKSAVEDTFLQKIAAPIQKTAQPSVTTKIVTQPQKTAVTAVTQTKTQTKQQKPKTQIVTAPTQVKVNQPSLVQTNKTPQTKTVTQTTPSANYSALTQRVQSNAQKSVTAQTQAKTSQAQKTQQTQHVQQSQTSQSAANMPVIRTTTSTSSSAVQNQQTMQNQQTAQKAVVDEKTLKQELTNYKVSLRNTIGKKINFTNVVGDGECIVSFKIASGGKLINREFTKQSSNLTLNNAVYAAVNSTPTFSAPPSGYKNETLNLRVKFYNGNFDISLY